MAFLDWLEHPNVTKGYRFENPKDIKLLRNGDFLIIENEQINILDHNFCRIQPAIVGRFTRLLEGQNGDVYTLEERNDAKRKKLYLRKLFKKREHYNLDATEESSKISDL